MSSSLNKEAGEPFRVNLQDEPGQKGLRGLTLRAFVIGIICSCVIAIAAPYSNMIVNSSYLAGNFIPIAVIFLFTIILVGGNILWAKVGKPLDISELITVYIMALLAAVIPTFGLTEYLLPTLAAPPYYADDLNKWEDEVIKRTPGWMVPYDPEVLLKKDTPEDIERAEKAKKQIAYFFEGIPDDELDYHQIKLIKKPLHILGHTIEPKTLKIAKMGQYYRPWLGPLAMWVIFLFALYFVMYCIMSILRKQWVERERLGFPLVQLPMEMVADCDQPKGGGGFFRNKFMWLGAAVPAFFATWNGLAHFRSLNFLPLIPTIPIVRLQDPGGLYDIRFEMNWPMVAFTYLIKLEVSMSVWLFFLLGKILNATFRFLGWNVGTRDPYSSSGFHPLVYHLCMGAVYILVLVGLWMARRHLKDVLKKAVFGDPEVDDSDEFLSYRTAFWGMLLGLAVMFVWLKMSGIGLGLLVVFVPSAFILFLAATRMVAEGGLVFVQVPMIPQTMLSRLTPGLFSPAGYVGMSYTYSWLADFRVFLMPSVANSMKLTDVTRMNRRHFILAGAAAILVAMAVSFWFILYLSYRHGGAELNDWFFEGHQRWAFDFAVRNISRPEDTFFERHIFTGLGAAIMGFLMFMRSRFLWWPLHPIGFPFSCVPAVERIWFPIFLGWLVKAVILKYGGVKLFRQLKPFFLGLIFGEFFGDGIWFLINCLVRATGLTYYQYVIYN